MSLLEVPYGNNQEVYISKEWLYAYDENFFPIPDEYETAARKERRAVVEYLTSIGYQVITDASKTSEDTFFFTPSCDKHLNANIEEYKEKKQEKIIASLECTEVHEPKTIRFNPDSLPEEMLPLPFVLKNIEAQGGTDKILIETPKQLAIFKKFYNEINEYSFKETIEIARKNYNLGPEVVFYEDGSSNAAFGIGRINYKERFYEDFVMQEYIKTPGIYNTSLRVLTSSSNDILCASLKYCRSMPKSNKHYGLVDRYLCENNNPYYLNSRNIISNTVAGGNSIILNSRNYSKKEKAILKSHEIDPDKPVVPESVVEASLSIATNAAREIGAISGMDFIYDSTSKSWKYLEQQEFPMMYTYCQVYNLPYVETLADPNDYDEFIPVQRRADIDSRLRALSLAMQKKNTNSISAKKLSR